MLQLAPLVVLVVPLRYVLLVSDKESTGVTCSDASELAGNVTLILRTPVTLLLI
jgi:hypothetical protein